MSKESFMQYAIKRLKAKEDRKKKELGELKDFQFRSIERCSKNRCKMGQR